MEINIKDPLTDHYKLMTPDGSAICPKWLKNLRPPSKVWNPNILSNEGNRIIKVTLTKLMDQGGNYTGLHMVVPYIAAIPTSSAMVHVVGLIIDPEGIRTGTAQISLDVYNKYQEMEMISL